MDPPTLLPFPADPTLAALVTVNLLLERRRPSRSGARGRHAWLLEGLKVAATFSLIATLWSLWNSPSVTEWVDLMTWWRLG